ncbi:MAG TPA: radical SAM family heme chaperone HemW [Chthoniobacteraceae bacterium]|jgi:oxygen-independent coproporphyrinogen-3 oxidase|nr:radical SAM family heme chaperone HemW [Chthoniobacteraceae bacterium]
MAAVEHLYFHIPFCPKLCPYCSFYVEVGSANKTTRFLDALLREVELATTTHDVQPRTIYFGGGTPSALSEAQLEYLLGGLRNRLDLSQLEEWDFEANPATVRAPKARLLHSLGVTRLSLGVQSWDDALLQTLGRVHSAAQAEETFHVLREAGFGNLNIDLMFAVPGQSVAQWEATLAKTIALQPEHVSSYCLTYEEDTDYFRRLTGGEFRQDDDRDVAFFETTMQVLPAAGWAQYEISNYARAGRESRHNQAYWRGADYLGFGPSAFSTRGLHRWQNIPDTAEYSRRILETGTAGSFEEHLTPAQRRGETLAFAMRTSQGVAAGELTPWQDEMREFQELGLLAEQDGRFRLTQRGKLMADSVAEAFV